MAIKEFISLDGVQQVQQSLKDLGQAGENALTQFRNLGTGNTGLDQLTVSFGSASRAAGVATSAATAFREGVRTLEPILRAAGDSIGGLGSFSLLARTGIDGLAVGLGASLLVAAQNAADGLANLQRSLQLILGTAAGKNAFDSLKASAQSLGSSVENLVPAFESIATAVGRASTFRTIDPATGQVFRGLATDTQKWADAVDAVNRSLELIGQSASQAAGPTNQFFQAISQFSASSPDKAIGLTLDEFIKLQDSAPAIANALQQAFGANLFEELQKGPKSLTDTLNALSQLDPKLKVEPIPATVKQSFDDLKNSATDLLATLGSNDLGVPQFLKDLNQGIQDSKTQITAFEQFFSADNFSISNALSSGWDKLVSDAQSAFARIETAWQGVVSFFNSTVLNPALPGGISGPQSLTELPLAGGGHVRGPGTSTSDSILAWLSDNEFVMRAASVRHYGVDLMHAINSMKLPKDFFRGFNMGGLVMPSFPMPTPQRFAGGGLAVGGGSGRSFTLVLDGKQFSVGGSKSVVDELERAADLHNLSCTGRAPGWVK